MRKLPVLASVAALMILPVQADAAAPAFRFDGSSAKITNRMYPLPVGRTLVYRGSEGGDVLRDVFMISAQVDMINGVRCRVVFDRLYRNGHLAETTRDEFAQDTAGNVHYFGEQTATLDSDGTLISTDGTWLAGLNGARDGIFMPAVQRVGDRFVQENAPGVAEDRFVIRAVGRTVTVPAGTFHGAVRTTETTLLEPGVLDEKFYAPGIGTVVERTLRGGDELLLLAQVLDPDDRSL
jgi:hypothetical protein